MICVKTLFSSLTYCFNFECSLKIIFTEKKMMNFKCSLKIIFNFHKFMKGNWCLKSQFFTKILLKNMNSVRVVLRIETKWMKFTAGTKFIFFTYNFMNQ